VTGPQPVAARESATGAIYDLGYRGYDGPRLGRSAAVVTLFWHSLRAAFGWGRSGRSKIVPWGLAAITLAPAAVATAIAALVPFEGASPFSYDNYLAQVTVPLALFVAAQAPELVSGDQRNRVLSLYFSHALQRSDYALAKLGAMTLATFIVGFAPMLVLFLGKVLVASDVPAALGDELANLPQVVVAPIVYGLPIAALALAIAAWTPRRAYATGAIIAVFMVTAAVSGIFAEATGGRLADIGLMLNPFNAADATRDLLVGEGYVGSVAGQTDLPLWIFAAELALVAVIAIGAVLWRYRRVSA
jgi:ABC-2 type transport system permease protein